MKNKFYKKKVSLLFMDSEKKFELIKRNAEEILTEEDLRHFIESKEELKHYIGFEISGKIHLGTGIMSMAKVKDFMDAGVKTSVFLADWHTWINDKLEGDRERIKSVALGYFKEGLKASMKCLDGNSEKIDFVLGSELYKNTDYWSTVVEVSRHSTLARIKRSITIMGRKEGEAIDFAKMLYPPMQAADIFFQGINLAHSGMDQRKAHVIARDTALKIKLSQLKNSQGKPVKPIAVHHPLLLGLGKPPEWPVQKENLKELLAQMKMSKSNPDSCIFIHDSEKEIERKMNNAFCPEKETEFNPVLNWAKHLLFREEGFVIRIKRPEKFGGNTEFSSFKELEKEFAQGNLHPLDLKKAVAENLIELLEPARKHFEKEKGLKALEELEEV